MAYEIHTDVRYRPLERIEMGKLADECTVPWWNQTLCQVNDCVARVGVFHGEFHWHKHDREDELFLVIEGRLTIQLRDGDVTLRPGQLFVVPRGVEHCPIAEGDVAVMLIEPAGVVNTGSSGGELTASYDDSLLD